MRWDIRRRLYFVVGLLALNLGAAVWAGVTGMAALSSVRAFVGGEGLWAKNQKDALHSLGRYARDRDVADWLSYTEHIRIPKGDKKARLALDRPRPDYAAADAGFIEGGN